jgi:hypothetical protein
LRQTMNEINQAMGKALPLIHGNRFNDGDYQALATTVSQKVAYAVENCKLDARPMPCCTWSSPTCWPGPRPWRARPASRATMARCRSCRP